MLSQARRVVQPGAGGCTSSRVALIVLEKDEKAAPSRSFSGRRGNGAGHVDASAEQVSPALPTRPVSRHGRVTAVSMMKDEGPYLLEWVAHHLAVGFTDIVVYTNDCTDGTVEMLQRLECLGLAHHRHNVIPKGVKPQPSAIKHAQAEPIVGQSDWVMVFDADEFLCIRHGDGTLDGLLDAVVAEGANGIVITWRIFGSGGLRDWSRDLVTERYLQAAPPMWNKGWGVKTLFRFDPERWKLGIHRPTMKNKVLDTEFPQTVRWLNGSGQGMEDYFKFRGWRSIVRTVGYDWAQMNHYAVKAVDDYAIRRLRGNVNNKANKYDPSYWALQDRNEVRDDTMLRYAARRRAIFDGLLADPELNRLHHAAVERAEARLAAFKATPGYARFVDDLRAASAVPITQVSAKPPKPRDPVKIAAKMSNVQKRAAAGPGKTEPGRRVFRPPPLYVEGEVDLSAEPPMEWIANHSIELPADPRLFTPLALELVRQGKFLRNPARKLPGIVPENGLWLELGGTTGFLAAHLVRSVSGLRAAVHEDNPAHRTFIRRLWTRNAVAECDRLDMSDVSLATEPQALGARLAELKPAALALGDPRLRPSALADAVAASDRAAPPQLYLLGRLWADRQEDWSEWKRVLRALGYHERLPLDPAVIAAFRRHRAAA